MGNELEECPRDFLKNCYYYLNAVATIYYHCGVNYIAGVMIFCELLLDVIWYKISPEMNCDVAILHSPIY